MAKGICLGKKIALIISVSLVILFVLYEPYVGYDVTCRDLPTKNPLCRLIFATVSHISSSHHARGVSSNSTLSLISTGRETTVIKLPTNSEPEGVTVDSSNVCSSELCFKYSQHILNNMDLNTDPCDDFYQFACGGFIKSHPIHDATDHVDHLKLKQARIYESLESMIGKSHGKGLFSIVRHLFNSCSSEFTDRTRDLNRLLSSLTMDDDLYQVWSNILVLNLEHILTIEPWTDESFRENEIIYARISRVKNNLLNDTSSYTRFIHESFVYFFQSSRNEYKDLSQQIVEFEIDFTSSLVEESTSQQLTWIELSQAVIRELSLKYTRPSRVSPLQPLSYIGRKYFSNGVLKAYLKWVVIRELGFLSGPKFRAIEAKYRKTAPLRDRCKKLLLNYTSDLMLKLYIEEKSIENRVHGIQMLKNNTSAIFRQLINEKTWISDEAKEIMLQKLDHLKLDIGSPGWNLTDKYLREKYLPLLRLISNNHSFFSILRKTAIIATKYKFIDFRHQEINGITQDKFLETEVSYYTKKNVITITAPYLDDINYNSALPQYINYAGIGIDLAHELVHGYISESGESDYTGWPNFELMVMTSDVAERSTCLIELYNTTVDPATKLHLRGERHSTLVENTADNAALKMMSMLYERVASTGQELSLPNFQAFTPSQMFFIAYANNWCANTGIERLSHLIKNNAHLPHKYRVNIPLRNNPVFRDAFKCHKITQPICEVW